MTPFLLVALSFLIVLARGDDCGNANIFCVWNGQGAPYYDTISLAISAASGYGSSTPAVKIRIKGGTYAETLTVNFAGSKYSEIVPFDGETVVLEDNSDDILTFVGSAKWWHIHGGNGGGKLKFVMTTAGHNGVVVDSYNSQVSRVWIGPGIEMTATDVGDMLEAIRLLGGRYCRWDAICIEGVYIWSPGVGSAPQVQTGVYASQYDWSTGSGIYLNRLVMRDCIFENLKRGYHSQYSRYSLVENNYFWSDMSGIEYFMRLNLDAYSNFYNNIMVAKAENPDNHMFLSTCDSCYRIDIHHNTFVCSTEYGTDQDDAPLVVEAYSGGGGTRSSSAENNLFAGCAGRTTDRGVVKAIDYIGSGMNLDIVCIRSDVGDFFNNPTGTTYLALDNSCPGGEFGPIDFVNSSITLQGAYEVTGYYEGVLSGVVPLDRNGLARLEPPTMGAIELPYAACSRPNVYCVDWGVLYHGTIAEAVAAAKLDSGLPNRPVYVKIKGGTYHESVTIDFDGGPLSGHLKSKIIPWEKETVIWHSSGSDDSILTFVNPGSWWHVYGGESPNRGSIQFVYSDASMPGTGIRLFDFPGGVQVGPNVTFESAGTATMESAVAIVGFGTPWDFVIIESCTFVNPSDASTELSVGVWANASSDALATGGAENHRLIVRHCTFQNVKKAAVRLELVRDVYIESNYFWNDLQIDDVIATLDCGTIQVYNNFVHVRTVPALPTNAFFSSRAMHGILWEVDDHYIRHNTFICAAPFSNPSAVIRLIGDFGTNGPKNVRVQNNLFVGCGTTSDYLVTWSNCNSNCNGQVTCNRRTNGDRFVSTSPPALFTESNVCSGGYHDIFFVERGSFPSPFYDPAEDFVGIDLRSSVPKGYLGRYRPATPTLGAIQYSPATCYNKIATDPQACNGEGKCIYPDTCVCDTARYVGLQCDTPVCWGTPAASGACGGPGNGTCIGVNDCFCFNTANFDGVTCDEAVCGGAYGASACGGPAKGWCFSPDSCECSTPNYAGPNCDQPVCDGHYGPAACGGAGNGSCIVPGSCVCINTANFDGPSCNEAVCDESCNGTCSSPGNCVCSSPLNWDGPNCDQPVCWGTFGASACGGSAGSCVGPNDCACVDPDHGGSNCDLPVCDGHFGPEVCGGSGNGTCVAPGPCSCINTANFDGSSCNQAVCFGAYGSAACGSPSNGSCASPGLCNCINTPNFGGPECDQPTCNGQYGSAACGGPSNGRCSAPGVCSCINTPNFNGANCEQPVCGGLFGAAACATPSKGYCSSPGHCVCVDPGNWNGPNCDQAVCSGSYGSAACGGAGNGTCTTPGSCACINTPNFDGSNCDEPVCGGQYGALACGTPTKGYCSSPGVCTCVDSGNWDGANCDQPVCVGAYGAAACGGPSNGLCTSPGSCNCVNTANFRGSNCDEPVCNGNFGSASCGGPTNGTCSSPGSCSCTNTANFQGANCDEPVCGGLYGAAACGTPAKGYCMSPGACVCVDTGNWDGLLCSDPVCDGAYLASACGGPTNGFCGTPGSCTCINTPNYQGQNCDEPVCAGHFGAVACGGSENGACTAPAICTCANPGMFNGVNCDEPVCGSGRSGLAACGGPGNGSCNAPGPCICTNTGMFNGPDCDLPVCAGSYGLSACGTFLKGYCRSPGRCVCVDSTQWGGANCDQPVCNGEYGLEACGGPSKGSCTSPGYCTCVDTTKHDGENCDESVCAGRYGAAACGGPTKGTCLGVDSCSCKFLPDGKTLWIGENCDSLPEGETGGDTEGATTATTGDSSSSSTTVTVAVLGAILTVGMIVVIVVVVVALVCMRKKAEHQAPPTMVEIPVEMKETPRDDPVPDKPTSTPGGETRVMSLLKACGLDKLIPAFVEDGVEWDDLDKVTEDELSELIPRKFQRVKFLKRYELENSLDRAAEEEGEIEYEFVEVEVEEGEEGDGDVWEGEGVKEAAPIPNP